MPDFYTSKGYTGKGIKYIQFNFVLKVTSANDYYNSFFLLQQKFYFTLFIPEGDLLLATNTNNLSTGLPSRKRNSKNLLEIGYLCNKLECNMYLIDIPKVINKTT